MISKLIKRRSWVSTSCWLAKEAERSVRPLGRSGVWRETPEPTDAVPTWNTFATLCSLRARCRKKTFVTEYQKFHLLAATCLTNFASFDHLGYRTVFSETISSHVSDLTFETRPLGEILFKNFCFARLAHGTDELYSDNQQPLLMAMLVAQQ